MKVTDSKSINSVAKKKKSSKTGKASGVSFDSMVDAVSGVDNVESTAATAGVGAVGGVDADASGGADYVPTDARSRGDYILENLEQLEKDILLGSDSDAIERLRTALSTKVEDGDTVPAELQEILDEIEMRASIEIAKMEAAKEEE